MSEKVCDATLVEALRQDLGSDESYREALRIALEERQKVRDRLMLLNRLVLALQTLLEPDP